MTRIKKKGEENVIDFQRDFRQGQVQEIQQITGGTAICLAWVLKFEGEHCDPIPRSQVSRPPIRLVFSRWICIIKDRVL